MIEEQPLVKGYFSPADAKEIILALFTSKIQFHNNSAFGMEEKTGIRADHHRRRASELSNSLKLLLNHLEKSKETEAVVKIDCLVNMAIVKQHSEQD